MNLEVGDVPAVFRAGNLDAALIWEPGFFQLLAVDGATLLGMDKDTEVYRRFGTMTGPDVLILSKSWTDADASRATRFLAAYFKALAWVAGHTDQATALVQGRYIQQRQELIHHNLEKFVWHDAEDNRRVMSDQGILAQADYILDILYGQMKAIPVRPDFRRWANLEVLPRTPVPHPAARRNNGQSET